MNKKHIEIIPLIDCKKKKLDGREIYESLIDNYGRGTDLFKKFNFFCVDGNFPEKDPNQKYEKSFEISCYPEKYNYIVGQSGLFLKVESDNYSVIMAAKTKSKKFVSFCKKHLFIPIGIAHFSDGDCYLKNADNIHLYGDVEMFEGAFGK